MFAQKVKVGGRKNSNYAECPFDRFEVKVGKGQLALGSLSILRFVYANEGAQFERKKNKLAK